MYVDGCQRLSTDDIERWPVSSGRTVVLAVDEDSYSSITFEIPNQEAPVSGQALLKGWDTRDEFIAASVTEHVNGVDVSELAPAAPRKQLPSFTPPRSFISWSFS